MVRSTGDLEHLACLEQDVRGRGFLIFPHQYTKSPNRLLSTTSTNLFPKTHKQDILPLGKTKPNYVPMYLVDLYNEEEYWFADFSLNGLELAGLWREAPQQCGSAT